LYSVHEVISCISIGDMYQYERDFVLVTLLFD